MTLTLDNYKTFDNVAELNEAIRLHLREHKYKLNATAIKTLEVVSRHAVKYPGAAWLKIDSLTALIGKSAPTVRRALALLERLDIIERVAFMRPKRGGNGGNILRIVAAVPAADRPSVIGRANRLELTDSSVEQAKEPTEAIDLKSEKELLSNNNTYSKPFTLFLSTVEAFIGKGDRKLVNRLYGVYLAHTSALKLAFDADKLLHIAIQAVRTTMQASKRKQIRNIAGYYNGTLDRMLEKFYFEDIQSYYL